MFENVPYEVLQSLPAGVCGPGCRLHYMHQTCNVYKTCVCMMTAPHPRLHSHDLLGVLQVVQDVQPIHLHDLPGVLQVVQGSESCIVHQPQNDKHLRVGACVSSNLNPRPEARTHSLTLLAWL